MGLWPVTFGCFAVSLGHFTKIITSSSVHAPHLLPGVIQALEYKHRMTAQPKYVWPGRCFNFFQAQLLLSLGEINGGKCLIPRAND